MFVQNWRFVFEAVYLFGEDKWFLIWFGIRQKINLECGMLISYSEDFVYFRSFKMRSYSLRCVSNSSNFLKWCPTIFVANISRPATETSSKWLNFGDVTFRNSVAASLAEAENSDSEETAKNILKILHYPSLSWEEPMSETLSLNVRKKVTVCIAEPYKVSDKNENICACL